MILEQATAAAHTDAILTSTPGDSDPERWMHLPEDGTPPSMLTVIVWDRFSATPFAAFFDSDENRWYSQADGTELVAGVATYWRHCLSPG